MNLTTDKQITITPDAHEVAAVNAINAIFDAVPAGVTVINKVLADKIEQWRAAVARELDTRDNSRADRKARERAQIRDELLRAAQEKLMAEKFDEMRRINHRVDAMTAKFIQENTRAQARFIKHVYGNRVK